MDLQSLAIFRMAKVKMDWVGQRQEILAENIANADTPHYKAHDIKSLDFKAIADQATAPRTTMVATDPSHMKAPVLTGPFEVQEVNRSTEAKLDGNPVSIEDQMQKMADGRTQYVFAINLIHKNLAMLKIASGQGGGG